MCSYSSERKFIFFTLLYDYSLCIVSHMYVLLCMWSWAGCVHEWCAYVLVCCVIMYCVCYPYPKVVCNRVLYSPYIDLFVILIGGNITFLIVTIYMYILCHLYLFFVCNGFEYIIAHHFHYFYTCFVTFNGLYTTIYLDHFVLMILIFTRWYVCWMDCVYQSFVS